MMLRSSAILMSIAVLVLAGAGAAFGQAPPTVWHALGIPQANACIKDSLLNKWGAHPGLERKPPLKRLADPANLESPNPAIKAAAEIKAQEDLKPQKIKALKYLASIGCGCYPGVAEAMMAALEDCTEEVRYVAARSIGDASGNNCARCGESCCTKELVEKMAERAYERDEEGCYLESSERVREALIQSMKMCCPQRRGAESGPTPDVVPTPDVRPTPDVQPTPDIPTPDVPTPEATAPDRQAGGSGLLAPPHDPLTPVKSASTSTRKVKTVTSSRRTWQNKAVQISAEEEVTNPTIATGHVSDDSEPVAPVLAKRVAAKRVSSTASEVMEDVRSVSAVAGPIRGYVVASNSARGMVEIHFQGGVKPARGDEVLVYHTYLLGRELVGSLQVVGYDGDHVIAAVRGTRAFKVASGDEAVIDNPSILARR